MPSEAPVAIKAPIDPENLAIVNQGVIGIILRPSETQLGAYEFYLLDHNRYSDDESGTPKTVHEGIGLLSETMKPDESPNQYKLVLGRGYVEEIMGIKPESVTPAAFQRLIEHAKDAMEANLTELGSFTHDFNYHNKELYSSHPNTRGYVHVFVDNDRKMDVGDICKDEVEFAGHLGVRDLDHPYIQYRTGYDTRLLLGSAELQDILDAHSITIAE